MPKGVQARMDGCRQGVDRRGWGMLVCSLLTVDWCSLQRAMQGERVSG